jgi:hypothetical protein
MNYLKALLGFFKFDSELLHTNSNHFSQHNIIFTSILSYFAVVACDDIFIAQRKKERKKEKKKSNAADEGVEKNIYLSYRL